MVSKGSAKVVTDRQDYHPGSTASISATGFDPNSILRFSVQIVNPGGTLGTALTWLADDDATGAASTSFYVSPAYASQTILLTATEVTVAANGTVTPVPSGPMATEVFTDSASTISGGSFTFGPALTDFTQTENLNLFNPALGTLTGVELKYSYGEQTDITLKNNAGLQEKAAANLSTDSTFSSANAGINALLVSPLTVSFTTGLQTLPPFGTYDSGPLTSTQSQDLLYSTTPDLANFIGTGTFGLTVATLTSESLSGGGGNVVATYQTTGTYSGSILYTYVAPGIALDKQVSVDGSTWVDVGSGVLNDPSALVGGKVYYRAIVTNTGLVTVTGVTVSDNTGLAFTFATTTLAGGSSETSNVSTATAVGGHQLDIATVTGTATLGGTTQTLTAVDTADYTGLTASIALDKQVSIDGTNWVDVGSGVLNDPSALVGGKVYFRTIVTNTGQVTETGVTVSDNTGLAFTFATTTLAAGGSETSTTATATAASGHNFDTATVTGTASLGSTTQTQTAVDTADYTGVTAAIALDKQVSIDGTNWVDVGSGVLNDPSALVGGKVYFRTIVTNTGQVTETGVTVSDNTGLAFTFATTTLAAGGSETSTTATATAASGHNFDTATVTGTASLGSTTQTQTAVDTADYTGVTAGIALDKQVSVDGSTWVDVGSGVLNDPSALVGGKVYFRTIVTNTGQVTETGVTVSDNTGLAFTFATTTLAAGGSETSTTATATAASGHNFDTATVTGTASLGSTTQTQTAVDTADYTGVTSGIALDKQVSIDGTNWVDVGSGVLNDPSALVGGKVYFRTIVTNTGQVTETGVTVSDNTGLAFTFATTTLAAGGSETSTTATATAASGHNFDTATVTGTASLGSTTQTQTAVDTADYTGVTAAIALDKQVSIDGTNWVDVGSGVLNDPSALVGGKVYFRTIVTNTGQVTETGVTVSDNTGLAFTFATTTLAAGGSETSTTATATAASGHNFDTATVTGTASLGSTTQTQTAVDTADYTGVTAAIALDKQVSIDGTNWVDVGSGVLNDPSALVGGKVYFRTIVTNTGQVTETGVTVSDNTGLAFTFATTTLAAGGSETSTTATATAASGHNFDTATVTGTASLGSTTQTQTAVDTADYTGVTAGIALDKQVSIDGTNWVDVGSGVLNDPSALVGGKVYFRTIVTNTGQVTETGVTVSDNTGLAFTFATTTLAAGGSETSTTATATAASGHNFDTATVTGTASLGSTTQTQTAVDTADYTGVTAAIALDKQVSVDGTTWVDVGSGVLSDPSALVGGKVYYRAIVTNTGAVTATGITVSDNTGLAFTFATTTLAAGTSETSTTATATAASGHNFDTATVTGTASLGSTTQTPTATDTADYTGVTAAIALDKQVSVDGSTWVDVGSGVLNDPSALVGGKVYYRAIVTNTGQVTATGITVSDNTGLAFTFATTTLAAGTSETSNVSTVTAVGGHQLDIATVTGTAALGSTTQTPTAMDTADYTGVTAAIALDKQVSVDGTTWVDVGSGVLSDPSALVGGKVYYRAIVTNTGAVTATGITVSDNIGLAFTFATTTLAAGTSETSNVSTVTAVGGHQLDIATVAGTVTLGSTTQTPTAMDTADYTGVTAAIALDKQVSVDGSTWVDVGSGVLSDPSALVGGKVYYRAIVTNTGAVTATGITVSDNTGLAFTFATTTLAAGTSATSNVSTVTAVGGHQLDIATVTGTAALGSTTQTPTAMDTADYTGVTAAIALDKQVSVDGTTWVDVGSGVLGDPSALVGGKVYYRAIVTNTGAVTATGITVSDNTGLAFTFATTTLAAGTSETSNVSTVTAVGGHQIDIATVTGTVTLGSTTQTPTAVDTAEYSGVTAAIALDKQVSVDGSTWVDVGSGVLNDPSALVGGNVYYRAIVTNIGAVTATGITVSDVNGPTFTFATMTLAAGATVTSSVSTIAAVSGHQIDTATVTGTASLGSTTQTLTAVDTADYTGVHQFVPEPPAQCVPYWSENCSSWKLATENGVQGVLLGDANGDLKTDNGEITLFVPATDAVAIMSMDVAYGGQPPDLRTSLMAQAIATQLNINSGLGDPGYNPNVSAAVTGQDLISQAVQWLTGMSPFPSHAPSPPSKPYADGSSGNVDTNGNGVLDGSEFNSISFQFNSPAVGAGSDAWTQQSPPLAPTSVTTNGQGLENALAAFNANQLVLSLGSYIVGWNQSGAAGVIPPSNTQEPNTPNQFWSVLQNQVAANPTTLHGIG